MLGNFQVEQALAESIDSLNMDQAASNDGTVVDFDNMVPPPGFPPSYRWCSRGRYWAVELQDGALAQVDSRRSYFNVDSPLNPPEWDQTYCQQRSKSDLCLVF